MSRSGGMLVETFDEDSRPLWAFCGRNSYELWRLWTILESARILNVKLGCWWKQLDMALHLLWGSVFFMDALSWKSPSNKHKYFRRTGQQLYNIFHGLTNSACGGME